MKLFEMVKKYCREIESHTIPYPSVCCRVIVAKNLFKDTFEIKLERIPLFEGEDVENDNPSCYFELTSEQGEKLMKFFKRINESVE